MKRAQGLQECSGWKGLQGTKTGYFHTEHIQGRWWFVGPDGFVFLSLGINHMWRNLLRTPYNNHIFESAYEGSFDHYYSKSIERIRSWGFNTISEWEGGEDVFERLQPNIVYGRRMTVLPIAIWETWRLDDSSANKTKLDITSFTHQGHTAHDHIYEIHFPDVFDPQWEQECRETVRRFCIRHKDEPNLLGYYYNDIPLLNPSWWWEENEQLAQAERVHGVARHVKRFYDLFRERGYPSWIDSLKKRGRDSKAKQVFVELMRTRYAGNVALWNESYDDRISDFDELCDKTDYSIRTAWDKEAYRQDDLAFLRVIARRYYATVHRLIKEFDPDHLILGDRYDGDAGIPDVVLEEAGPYIDVVSIEYYQYDSLEEHLENIRRFHALSGKPVLLCDSCFSTATPGMPGIIGPECSDRAAVGRRYADYFHRVFRLPFVIGWHWCGYIDRLESNEAPFQHPGLVSSQDEPYQEVLEHVVPCNRSVYSVARKNFEQI
jgi:hypothetical protein